LDETKVLANSLGAEVKSKRSQKKSDWRKNRSNASYQRIVHWTWSKNQRRDIASIRGE